MKSDKAPEGLKSLSRSLLSVAYDLVLVVVLLGGFELMSKIISLLTIGSPTVVRFFYVAQEISTLLILVVFTLKSVLMITYPAFRSIIDQLGTNDEAKTKKSSADESAT